MIEIALYVGLFTTHLAGTGWNEQNNLVAIEYNRVVVGAMTNSLGNDSYIAGYNNQINDWSGVIVGAATGYDYSCVVNVCDIENADNDDVVPVVAPYLTWGGGYVLLQGAAVNAGYKINF